MARVMDNCGGGGQNKERKKKKEGVSLVGVWIPVN
jgi:hypothetical protein